MAAALLTTTDPMQRMPSACHMHTHSDRAGGICKLCAHIIRQGACHLHMVRTHGQGVDICQYPQKGGMTFARCTHIHSDTCLPCAQCMHPHTGGLTSVHCVHTRSLYYMHTRSDQRLCQLHTIYARTWSWEWYSHGVCTHAQTGESMCAAYAHMLKHCKTAVLLLSLLYNTVL